ncbi:hypothetical protein C8Q69DRAFT_471151 [Paecilomyces variotii]|uniref:Uncharacterized protein n=1 Tax=Byssochlamys spectabilis TaxID=264951 RepID=A0A443HSC5_BYSSP|nr:hypothetical protein C8Q69DRAFT_471151 [Paecilomyces variotii]RWQ94704.1 hypothetical protein C8Q69DRAFT_471151 [Paecilomyces variotii]
MNQAKRVILRIPEPDFNPHDPYEAVRLYLEKNGRSATELETGRHFIHIQPSNSDITQRNPKIYIIMDIEKDCFSGPIHHDFPHEIYRICRVDNKLMIGIYRDSPWYRNFYREVRKITDESYPWGKTRRDCILSGDEEIPASES